MLLVALCTLTSTKSATQQVTVRSLTSRPNTSLVAADTAFLSPHISAAGFAWLFSGGSPFSVGSSQNLLVPYCCNTG